MNKATRRIWLIYLIPSIFLLVSIGLMAGGSLLKQPFGSDDRLYDSMKKLEQEVKNKEWSNAKQEIEYAQQAWKKIVNRIQFSAEREYLFQISGTLARIRGGVEAEDDQAILEEIYFFYDLWESLGT